MAATSAVEMTGREQRGSSAKRGLRSRGIASGFSTLPRSLAPNVPRAVEGFPERERDSPLPSGLGRGGPGVMRRD
jgi:hypothetical protein